jgi:hypothetical protein
MKGRSVITAASLFADTTMANGITSSTIHSALELMKMPNPPKIVLGIPGLWQTRSDFVEAIARDGIARGSKGFIFAGRILMNVASGTSWELELRPHTPRLVEAFTIANRGSIDEATIRAIAKHTFTAYIIGPGGSLDAARSIMSAAVGVLHAGGLAVKVESAGVAHSSEQWKALTTTADAEALYYAYVTMVGQEDNRTFYSCGMHNLGLRDAIITGNLTAYEAGSLLNTFLLYSLIEQPQLVTGHTFSVDAQSPRYRLSTEACTIYPEDRLFNNPFGLWRLSPLQSLREPGSDRTDIRIN